MAVVEGCPDSYLRISPCEYDKVLLNKFANSSATAPVTTILQDDFVQLENPTARHYKRCLIERDREALRSLLGSSTAEKSLPKTPLDAVRADPFP